MPPTRTFTPVKVTKTERTHEENQERAYIAASRRSDRSIEARIESARRASEIHKRRTGRSLRVTEQDVINEEMYEEEGDDLPLHYRRLTAHLQTGSADFNRRLAAYLTNQVAMRSAMDQMINQSFAQQYPNAPQFVHNSTTSSYSSPFVNQQSFAPAPGVSYRTSPYPSPHQPNFQNLHKRANSVAISNEINGQQGGSNSGSTPQASSIDARRMSMPVTTSSGGESGIPPLMTEDSQNQRQTQMSGFSQQDGNNTYPPLWQDSSFFTTSLSLESQQLLGPALDPNDPLTASLMAGSEQFLSHPDYPWRNQQDTKTDSAHYDGVVSTLAPSALEIGHDSLTATTSTSEFNPSSTSASSPGIGLSPSINQSKSIDSHFTPQDGNLESGQVTPGDNFWESFMQDGSWTEDTTTS